MQRYALILAYNGKRYHGWQIQPNASTVQEEIRNALQTVFRHKICLHGAGRTDAGVHASFFVAHFDTENEILNISKLKHSLNGILDNDIAIYDIINVQDDFNSRFDAVSRTYKYYIHNIKNPFVNYFSHKFIFDLDIEKMNKASEVLLEFEDFKSFEKAHSDTKTSLCDVKYAHWELTKNGMVLTITANRFLRNMVRSIVGTMLDIGQNKTSLKKFVEIIEAKDRQKAGKSANASGLFLSNIKYPEPVNILFEEARKLSEFKIF